MTKDCIFCNRANFEDRIISEDENSFVIATLGQITDGGYLLLVPKRHVSCIGAMGYSEMRTLDLPGSKIVEVLKDNYGTRAVTIFEHGIVGQTVPHAHIHFLPAFCRLTEKVKQDFPEAEIESIDSRYFWLTFSSFYKVRRKPYLMWQSEDKKWNICWDPPAPLQYFRLITAEILDRPERGNWRNMDPELDRKLRTETMERLKKYF